MVRSHTRVIPITGCCISGDEEREITLAPTEPLTFDGGVKPIPEGRLVDCPGFFFVAVKMFFFASATRSIYVLYRPHRWKF
jgi:hypothetical protein